MPYARKPIKYVIIDGFVIDATLTEEHSLNSEVTMHPVEKGGDITDHVRPLPIEVSIHGIVSDTPFGDIADLREETSLPSQQAYDKFKEIYDNRQPITVETNLQVYENVVLENLSIPQSSRVGHAFEFTAKFRQIEVVTNERTTVNIELPRAKRGVDLGSKPSLSTEEGAQDVRVKNVKFYDVGVGKDIKDRAAARKKLIKSVLTS